MIDESRVRVGIASVTVCLTYLPAVITTVGEIIGQPTRTADGR